MNGITPRITEEDNDYLSGQFNEDEVKRALFQMHPEKALGVDGFSVMFYQRFWEVVKDDTCGEILQFLNNDQFDEKLNLTQIILLPKKQVSDKVEDFRPISLCNVSMKIITKVIANRLRECLPKLISHNQSAFLKNRLISDNLIIAQEAYHCIRKRSKGNQGFFLDKAGHE